MNWESVFFKIGLKLAVVLGIFLVIGSIRLLAWFWNSSSFSRRGRFATLSMLVLAALTAAVIIPQETDYRDVLRHGVWDTDCIIRFVKTYPNGYRLRNVEQLVWRSASAMTYPSGCRLYRKLFPHGQYAAQLDGMLAAKRERQLKLMRTVPDIELGSEFLRWFPDSADAPEVRERLLCLVESQGKAGHFSPPPDVLRRTFAKLNGNPMTYHLHSFKGWQHYGEATYRACDSMLHRFFDGFGLGHKPVWDDEHRANVEIDGEWTEDPTAVYRSSDGSRTAFGVVVRARIVMRIPGETKAAWTTEISVATPDDLQGQSIAGATSSAFEKAIDGALRYR